MCVHKRREGKKERGGEEEMSKKRGKNEEREARTWRGGEYISVCDDGWLNDMI